MPEKKAKHEQKMHCNVFTKATMESASAQVENKS